MKNVPDGMMQVLLNRPGDLPLPDTNRWGKVQLLHNGGFPNPGSPPRLSLTFIATDVQPIITPMALMLRFSLDGQTFTREVPAIFGGNVVVDLIQMVDVKTGAFRETFTVTPGLAQPVCGVICRALQVSIAIDLFSDSSPAALWVQAVAAPTSSIDCADVLGPSSIPGMSIAASTRHAAVAASTYVIPANPTRGLFTIVNQAAAPSSLFVLLGQGVSTTPGAELATIVLPGGVAAGYEIANWRGDVSFKFTADDATGYALSTQGIY